MNKITTFTAIKDLHAAIIRVDRAIYSDETKEAEREMRKRFADGQTLSEKILDGRRSYYASSLPVREKIMQELPETISIGPEMAFYLAADHQNYTAIVKKIDEKRWDTHDRAFKGMAKDAVKSIVHPSAIAGWAWRIGKIASGSWTHMQETLQADAERDALAGTILAYYKLTEIAPGKYALKRGKWDLEKIQGAYVSTYNEVRVENGLDSKLDFEKLKRSVDPDASKWR